MELGKTWVFCCLFVCLSLHVPQQSFRGRLRWGFRCVKNSFHQPWGSHMWLSGWSTQIVSSLWAVSNGRPHSSVVSGHDEWLLAHATLLLYTECHQGDDLPTAKPAAAHDAVEWVPFSVSKHSSGHSRAKEGEGSGGDEQKSLDEGFWCPSSRQHLWIPVFDSPVNLEWWMHLAESKLATK